MSLMPNPDRVISHKPKTETLFMAKNTQEAEVIVTMNGQAAKKAVAELAQEYEKLQKEALEAYKAGNDALGKKLDAQAQKLMKDIEITRRETKKFADVMKNINGASLKELRSAAKQLQSEINKLAPGTQAFIEKSKQLQQVNTRIRQLTNEFKGLVVEEKQAIFSLKGLADGFNKYFGMVTAGIAAVTGVSMAFRKAAEDAARLDDVYSDVMKTTGLLHEQVADLDKELMKIDTRTSREQLLLLARDAGKLGIQGKENILGFVRAADQIQVALGEDLGEGAIRNLGKIADVLGYTKSMGIEKSLLSIASSINAVGQASTASESYLVDFTQRMAGVAAQTGISAANIIGFASGLDQSAMKVEMASTAFQKFLMKLYEDPAKFAAYANLEVGKFTDLLKNDANQAVITILKALKDQDGFASLVPIFKDMGLDGARAVSVLAAMATNINAVTDAQALANKEFAKATSVTEEYNTKNNNMRAQLEKARKEFQNASITLGQSLNPIMLKSTKATTYLIKALVQYGKEIKAVLITLAALTIAVKASTIAHAAYHAVVKGITAIQGTFTVAIKAASYAINIMRGRTVAATKAYLAMKAAMSTSVFGAIATAASALVVVITRLINKEKEAANAMTYVQSVEKKVVETYAEEEAKVRTLHAIVKDNNIALDQRRKALKELQEIVPEYHASLDKEGKLIEGNTVFLDKYIEKLREATRWQVYKDEWQDLETQLVNIQDKIAEARQKAQEELTRNGGNATEKTTMIVDTWGGGSKVEETYTEYGKLMRTVRFYEEQENEILGKQEQIRGRMAQLTRDETRELSAMEKEIQAVEQKYELLFNEAKNAYVGAPAEGMKALGKLQEEMNAEIAAIRKKYAQPENPEGGGGGGGGGGLSDKEAKKAFDKEIALLEQNMREEEIILKQSLMNREITQAEYNARMNLLTMKSLQERINIAKKYGQDETKYMSQLLDEEFKLIGDGMEELQQSVGHIEIPVDIADPQAYDEFWNQIYKKRDDIVAKLQDTSLKTEYDTELQWIEKLHEQELLSEEQFQQAKLQTKMEYLQKYAQQYQTIQEQASNFVAALKEAESAQLEAEYQKQLSAAGDNAEERERIEAEYEQKQLDLKKKYADVEMGVNIAKTVANGAVAAIKAFADAGPVAGAILAALIAATTAAEVATIIAQRNAIKNASVSSGGGSSSVPKTGERKMTGYAEGGYTEDHTTLTTVGEKGREWVGPAWMVRKNPVMFANLERYRKSGSHGRSGSMSRGFADGGFTDKKSSGIDTSISQQDILNAIKEGAKEGVKEGLDGEYINAIVQYGDILIAAKKYENFKKQTTR